jgi:hypothetical protein
MAEDIDDVRSELTALRASHEALLAQVNRRPVTRRDLLRLAAAGAGGLGVASVVGATPAAAVTDDVAIGADNSNPIPSATTLETTGSMTGAQVLFQSGDSYVGTDSDRDAALAGWADLGGSATDGVYAFSEVVEGVAIYAVSNDGPAGVFQGSSAALVLISAGAAGPPASGAATIGQIQCFDDGVWLCVTDGTPGTWRRLQGATSAGAYTTIPAVRVYDSRPSSPLAKRKARTVTVVNSVTSKGKVKRAGVVPRHATTITGLVTCRAPSKAGELALYPAGRARPVPNLAFGKREAITTPFTVGLGAAQKLTLWSSAKTDVTVDVTGYYL